MIDETENQHKKAMISQEQFLELRKDVKDIKSAMTGNKAYGLKGFSERLENAETSIYQAEKNRNELRDEFKEFKNKIIYWTAGAAAAATAIINVIISIWPHA